MKRFMFLVLISVMYVSSVFGSPGQVTLIGPGPIYQAESYGSSPNNLSAAITALGSTNATIQFHTNQTGGFTVPPNITIQPVNGAILTSSVTGLPYAKPEWFGAVADGITNSSNALSNMLSSLAVNGVAEFGSGVYIGTLTVLRSDLTIKGQGAAVTTLRQPAGVSANTLEIGNCAAGNGATPYTNITVSGMTLDGNSANTPSPANDLTGWAIPITAISYSRFDDIAAINAWNGGMGVFINSNYNTFSGIYTANNLGTGGEPGFDVNSSKYNSFTGLVSNGDLYGFRLLDNCWGNFVDTHIYNATISGVILNNQLVNESHGNIVNATIEGGCVTNGMQIGANFHNSIINITTNNISGGGIQLIQYTTTAGSFITGATYTIASSGTTSFTSIGAANNTPGTVFIATGAGSGTGTAYGNSVNNPYGNTINLSTRNSGAYSALIGGDNNILNITSTTDGLTGSQGSWYAVDITGNNNTIKLKLVDSPTWQIRTIEVMPGAVGNEILSVDRNDSEYGATPLYGLTIDYGSTHTKWSFGNGYGVALSSAGMAGQLEVPLKGDTFLVTGTTAIASGSVGLYPGRRITLNFQSSGLSVYNGNNLVLNGNYTSSVNGTLTLQGDATGTNWIEIARNGQVSVSYVDLVSNQTIGGTKTFTNNLDVTDGATEMIRLRPAGSGSTNFIDFTNFAQNAYTNAEIIGNSLSLFGNNGTGLTVGATGHSLINTTTDNGTDQLQVNGSMISTTLKQSAGINGGVGNAVCFKSGGALGYCSSVVSSSGTCTCN